MNTGKVKFFNDAKGFGFIKDNATGQEIFVHESGLTDKIKQDDDVTYEIEAGKKGDNAVKVKKA